MSILSEGLEQLIQTEMAHLRVPAVAFGLIENGNVVRSTGFGYKNLNSRKAVTDSTRFQLGSISKTLTAWGVMWLVEHGYADLDDPVSRYLTRWRLPDSPFNQEQVTIKNLLGHLGGISVHGYLGRTESDASYTLTDSLNGYVDLSTRVDILMEPGSTFHYSGGGYTILQLLVEELIDLPFEEFMERFILTPIGMRDSSFRLDRTDLTDMALPYDEHGKLWPQFHYTEMGAAGLISSLRDMLAFMLEHFNEQGAHQRVSQQSKALMRKRIHRPTPYGLGYQIIHLPQNEVMAMHGGINRGWRSRFAILPNKKDAMVILTNSDSATELINVVTKAWLNEIYGEIKGRTEELLTMQVSF